MLLDTHCHLTDPRYETDLALVLERAGSVGVGGIVCVVSDLDDTRATEIVGSYRDGDPADSGSRAEGALPQLWRTVGIHPHAAGRSGGDLMARLGEALDSSERVVAIGECGLDFHYDFAAPADQRRVFDLQMRIAEDRDLPLVVHCREAEAEMAGRVRDAGTAGIRGVLHCFNGDASLLDTALEAGWLVSFTGLVTFKSFQGAESVRAVPAGRYMLETDGPYMAPVPHRGERNEPAFLPAIRDHVALLRGTTPDDVERETTEAARVIFRLPTGEA